ncbi:MAG: hypothetical protein D3926_22420 [Desulfobacteraceae bacterium]|nr:MAG: hypothetical protein D3926_22420 [Desulfobacteraceae bacterium]
MNHKKSAFIFLLMIAICSTCVIQAYANDNKQKRPIIYSTPEWAPFNYKNENGEPIGLYVEILKEIFEKEMDIGLDFQTVPWKRAQSNVKEGTADILVTVATQSRLEYALITEAPILELYLFAYTYKDHPKLDEINTISSGIDIKRLNLTPVTNLGNNWHKINIDDHGVNTHYVPSEKNAFMVLALERADITIEPLYAGSYLINQLGLSNQVVRTSGKFGPIIFHILLSKKSPYSNEIKQINRAIAKVVKSSRYQDILKYYEEVH